MSKLGRPRKDGAKESRFLFRAVIAQCAYDKARASGEKYEVGLDAAIEAVRRELPGVRMNRTEMKRILAEFRSEGVGSTILFEESDNRTSPDGAKHQKAWNIRIGQAPKYPRHNAET